MENTTTTSSVETAAEAAATTAVKKTRTTRKKAATPKKKPTNGENPEAKADSTDVATKESTTKRQPAAKKRKAAAPTQSAPTKEENVVKEETTANIEMPEATTAHPTAEQAPQEEVAEKNEEPKMPLEEVKELPADVADEAKASTADDAAAEEKNATVHAKEAHSNQQKTKEQATKANTKPAPITFVKPTAVINDIVELAAAPMRQIILTDQQIQQLTLEETEERYLYLEQMLARVLDYDVVLSDTNIWLELLVGHTSSHSDPRVNARLQFERQLEFISKITRLRRGKFMMMSETYEEIDRFATQMEPTNYQDADFNDPLLCRNVAARLAKRLILSQQRENRLRIEGIGAESHHAAFADPAIIRRTVEMFAQGKKVLLITNDASVAIRSLGLCDDLQRHNNIDDDTWEEMYVPVRPMACTFDDLKLLDNYTRQYHFLQQAAGKQWMEDVPRQLVRQQVEPLQLWMDAFRPGDKHKATVAQPAENNKRQQQKHKQQNQSQQPQPQQEKQVQQSQQQKQQPGASTPVAEDKEKQKQAKQQKQNGHHKQQRNTQQQNNSAEQTKQQTAEAPKQEPEPRKADAPASQDAPAVAAAEPQHVVAETSVAPEIPSPEEMPAAEEQKDNKPKRSRRPQRNSRRSRGNSQKTNEKPNE